MKRKAVFYRVLALVNKDEIYYIFKTALYLNRKALSIGVFTLGFNAGNLQKVLCYPEWECQNMRFWPHNLTRNVCKYI